MSDLHLNLAYYCSMVCALNKDIYMNRCHLPTDKLSTKQGRDLFCGANIRCRHCMCLEYRYLYDQVLKKLILAEGHSPSQKGMNSVLKKLERGQRLVNQIGEK